MANDPRKPPRVWSLLRAGKVDFVHTTGLLSGEEAIPLQRTNPDLKFFKYQSLNQGMFYMRTDQPPFNDIRVRRALSLAINRQAWMEGPGIRRGVLRHRAGAVCAARLAAGSRPRWTRPRPNIWSGSTARKRNACWPRPVTRRASPPRCITIQAYDPLALALRAGGG